jgi:hypothetical protein
LIEHIRKLVVINLAIGGFRDFGEREQRIPSGSVRGRARVKQCHDKVL